MDVDDVAVLGVGDVVFDVVDVVIVWLLLMMMKGVV